jgi:hypothetical protein
MHRLPNLQKTEYSEDAHNFAPVAPVLAAWSCTTSEVRLVGTSLKMHFAIAKTEIESSFREWSSATICLPLNQTFTMIGKCRQAITENTSEVRQSAPFDSALSVRLSSI